jgi:hypothetical protein
VNGVSAHDAVNYDGYSTWWIWWLEHGLDGVMGGLIAVAGVGGTLWYDRRARRETQKRAELRELRQQVTLAQDRVLRLRMRTHGQGEWSMERGIEWYGDLLSHVEEIRTHAIGVAPALADDLTGFFDLLVGLEGGFPDPPRLRRILIELEARLQGWVSSPEEYATTVPRRAWPGLTEEPAVTQDLRRRD